MPAEELVDIVRDSIVPCLTLSLAPKIGLLRNGAHFFLENLLNEDEKKELNALRLGLKDDHPEHISASSEAEKALKTTFRAKATSD